MRSSTLRSRPWAQPAVACLLIAATAASRVPFTSQMLYAWAPANFALALQQYNVVFHQPHPPGYPLYVGIAKLVDLWVQNPNASLVYVGIAASAGAVAALFLLASRMYDVWVGIGSAVILGASVGFWGYGEVAYPHTSVAFFGTLLAWLCYLMWQGHRSVAVLSGLVLGIAGGVRQDTLLFLGPLWLLSVWRTGFLRLLLSALVLCLVAASWTIPAVQLSGGWEAYWQAVEAQSSHALSAHSLIFAGGVDLGRNMDTLLLFLQQTFGLSLAVTVYFAGRFLTFKALVADHRLSFLLLWLLPPTIAYLLVQVDDPGYVLSLLPVVSIVTGIAVRDIAYDIRSALLLLSSRSRRLSPLAGLAGWGPPSLGSLLVAGLVAWNVHAFVATPGPVRLTEIRAIDNMVAKQVEYARQFQPGTVVILAMERFRQFKYYLPEYDLRPLFDEHQGGYRETRSRYTIPAGVTTVLVMDFGKEPASIPSELGEEVPVDSDPRRPVGLWRFAVSPGDTIEYGYDYFAVNGRS
ncbi:MAG: hypothetical protein ACM3US_08510 [Sphingomonadaceae bacterium]